MIHFSRRHLLVATGAAATVALPSIVHADGAWPNRPIRVVVPFAPGASIDAIARILAPRLSSKLGVPVVVENRTGAGGMIGTAFVATQPADGHTLVFTSNPFVIAPLLVPAPQKPLYDPGKDLQPVAQIAAAPLIITASNELGVTNLAELLAKAKGAPQTITYGSGGVGTVNHLSVELLARMAGVELVHVPFAGFGPAITALLGGHVQMTAGTFPSVLPMIREGRARALAVTGAQRSPLVPTLPTVAESGVAGYEFEAWWGLLGPAAMPPTVTNRLNSEINALLAAEEMHEMLARDGAVPRPGSAAQFDQQIKAEIPRWEKLIRDAKITA